jgi:hypothetical protein
VIPVVGTLTGQGDTSFVSDLLLANPADSSADLTVSFIPLGSSNRQSIPLTLAPGGSQTIADVLGTLFGISAGQGTVLVASSIPIAVSTRIASRKPEGDYATFAPAFNGGERIPDDGTAGGFGLPQTDTRRTHLFLYNRGNAGTVEIVGYDTSSNEIGRLHIDMGAGQAVRVNSVMDQLGASGQASGRITVTPGPGMAVFAQTAEADAGTGDLELTKLK